MLALLPSRTPASPARVRSLDVRALLWVTERLSRHFALPVDGAETLRTCPPPCSDAQLHERLAALGLSVEVTRTAIPDSDSVVVAWNADDEGSAVPMLAWQDRETGVLRVETFGQAGAETVALADFPPPGGAAVWRVTTPAVATVDDHGVSEPSIRGAGGRFGLRSFVPEILRHRAVWRDVLVASAVLQGLALGLPLLTQVVIDKVVVHHTRSTLAVVAVALVAIVLFSAIMQWLRQYLVVHTGNRIDAALGARVIGHLLRLPPSFFEHRSTGGIVSRLQGIETIREFVSGAAITLLLDVPFLLIFLAIMAVYSLPLTAIALACLTLIAIVSAVVTPRLRAHLDRQFILGARHQALLTEYVAAMPTVKTLQIESVVRQRYETTLADSLAASFRTRMLGNTYQVTAGSVEQLMSVAILAAGAVLVMSPSGFTVGMLVAFQMFASRMAQPLLRLVGLWQEFQRASVAVSRLGDLLDAPAEAHRSRSAAPVEASGDLRFEGVSFRYGPDRPWLYRGLDLTVTRGGVTLLVGASGVGKSTLTKLLLGFETPSEGAIRFGDRDLAALASNERRALFGVVPQETVLFAGTVRDNLLLASPHATFDDLVMACRLAGIHDDVAQMPAGYDTMLGEHGAGLSGGQRQRLAIARALLRRPRILVFDEATSHLDPATGEAFVRTVNALRGQATILFIAHAVPRGLVVDQVARLTREGVRLVGGTESELRAAQG